MSLLRLAPVGISALAIVLSTTAGLPLLPAQGSNPQISAPSGSLVNDAPSAPVIFAKIPASSEDIALSVETVKVKIRRLPGVNEISIASNCPSHWNVSGRVIRQVALSTASRGVSVRADATGAQAIVNGHIYQLPRDSDGAVHSLKIESEQVIINGNKLEPLKGSDVPGSCIGPDVLDVVVPDSYSGGLIVSCHGSSEVVIDSWSGGSVLLSLHDSSSVVAGKLNGLSKAVVDIDGLGKAELKAVTTKALVANINGGGAVKVLSGSSDLSNATISGSGTIVLKGKFKNLKKSINGTGSIQLLE